MTRDEVEPKTCGILFAPPAHRDASGITDAEGNQLYYFYYRCEYCGAFYKVGEHSYPDTMSLYFEAFVAEGNDGGLFEVLVDHIAMS